MTLHIIPAGLFLLIIYIVIKSLRHKKESNQPLFKSEIICPCSKSECSGQMEMYYWQGQAEVLICNNPDCDNTVPLYY